MSNKYKYAVDYNKDVKQYGIYYFSLETRDIDQQVPETPWFNTLQQAAQHVLTLPPLPVEEIVNDKQSAFKPV